MNVLLSFTLPFDSNSYIVCAQQAIFSFRFLVLNFFSLSVDVSVHSVGRKKKKRKKGSRHSTTCRQRGKKKGAHKEREKTEKETISYRRRCCLCSVSISLVRPFERDERVETTFTRGVSSGVVGSIPRILSIPRCRRVEARLPTESTKSFFLSAAFLLSFIEDCLV
jgi:hypothetical protein